MRYGFIVIHTNLLIYVSISPFSYFRSFDSDVVYSHARSADAKV